MQLVRCKLSSIFLTYKSYTAFPMLPRNLIGLRHWEGQLTPAWSHCLKFFLLRVCLAESNIWTYYALSSIVSIFRCSALRKTSKLESLITTLETSSFWGTASLFQWEMVCQWNFERYLLSPNLIDRYIVRSRHSREVGWECVREVSSALAGTNDNANEKTCEA
jgi:hypothetical protein